MQGAEQEDDWRARTDDRQNKPNRIFFGRPEYHGIGPFLDSKRSRLGVGWQNLETKCVTAGRIWWS
jgi:hypothetical protein